ncbi:MAG: apolipoprotein N-acyltransferase [Bacteroidia bacterium]|nr:apolipoprotein N-acyltransferase [Bacteroidia bacterium]
MIQNRKLKLALLTLLPGLLFWLAWPPRDFFFLSFIAFVPLFILENETNGRKREGWLIYAALLIWNILTTWWVWHAQAEASVFMMLANAFLMYLPWYGYRKARKHFGDSRALFVFITLWLSFEYLHLSWELTWPWLTLGNVFSKHNFTVQWYEITGALGGSLWVLLLNVSLYKGWQKGLAKNWLKPALLLTIPILISFVFGFLNSQVSYAKFETFETIIVQPNIDPYNDKFTPGEEVKNLVHMLGLAEKEITAKTRYVILPETAVVEYVDEDNSKAFKSIKVLKQFVKQHPNIHLITGISTYNFYDKNEPRSPTARETPSGQFYESYNTAMEVDSAGNIDYYHKSKLVPGAEKMPYPKLFGFLEYFSLDMGGISGSLGSDKEAKVFEAGNKPDLAPLICYESVFPGYVADFVNKGAEILLVITNDGWWKDTDGYKQHMYYASLRAIENRREVIRSANTGISCRITRKGKIIERTNWWEESVIKVQTNNHAKMTVYSKLGDYIGRIASFIGIFYILGIFVKSRIKNEISS